MRRYRLSVLICYKEYSQERKGCSIINTTIARRASVNYEISEAPRGILRYFLSQAWYTPLHEKEIRHFCDEVTTSERIDGSSVSRIPLGGKQTKNPILYQATAKLRSRDRDSLLTKTIARFRRKLIFLIGENTFDVRTKRVPRHH